MNTALNNVILTNVPWETHEVKTLMGFKVIVTDSVGNLIVECHENEDLAKLIASIPNLIMQANVANAKVNDLKEKLKGQEEMGSTIWKDREEIRHLNTNLTTDVENLQEYIHKVEGLLKESLFYVPESNPLANKIKAIFPF